MRTEATTSANVEASGLSPGGGMVETNLLNRESMMHLVHLSLTSSKVIAEK